MTKTALDFFSENVGVIYMKFGDKIINLDDFSAKYQEILEQAKQMEKQQIIDAHLIGLITSLETEATKQATEYYNETYGNKGSDGTSSPKQ